MTKPDTDPSRPQGIVSYRALVDSGSDWCVFGALIGAEIGLDVKSGDRREFGSVEGVGGAAFFHEVILRVGEFKLKVRAGFAMNFHLPYGVLGQAGFFDRFIVTMSSATAQPFTEIQPLQ